jgi:hypothetical protein
MPHEPHFDNPKLAAAPPELPVEFNCNNGAAFASHTRNNKLTTITTTGKQEQGKSNQIEHEHDNDERNESKHTKHDKHFHLQEYRRILISRIELKQRKPKKLMRYITQVACKINNNNISRQLCVKHIADDFGTT